MAEACVKGRGSRKCVEEAPSSLPPTERQRAIHRFMLEHQRDRRVPASIRECMAEFGVRSPNGMLSSLRALVRKGYVERLGHGLSRSWIAVDVESPRCPCCRQAVVEEPKEAPAHR